MKKLILMMLFAVPMLASAQGMSKVADRSGQPQQNWPHFYGEVLVTQQQNREIVRVVFENEMIGLITDKSMRKEIDLLRTYSFNSVLHALNTLTAMGWEVGDTYELTRRTGDELHILVHKESPKMLMPNLSAEKDKEGGKVDQRKGR